MPLTEEEVFSNVRDVLVEALAVDDDEVVPEATIFGNLGAESIDVLDIQFRLEKAFNFKIEPGEMFPDNVRDDPQYVQDNKVTDKGMEELRKRLPHVDLDAFDANREMDELTNIFTVDTVVKFVQSKLAS